MMGATGILNLHKPPGWTSRKVVDVVQRLARPAKAGHAGTLDPLATGVLVVCVGDAVRLIEYVQRYDKEYLATFLLGRTSDTEDVEGTVVVLPDAKIPTRGDLETAARRFLGRIEQRPPAFSAVKVAGRRSYDLARAGQAVDLPPRPVEIHELEILAWSDPVLRLRVRCGSGTYVRSLGRDLARAVGSDAVMSVLTRTRIGPFELASSVCPTTLEPATWKSHLGPARDAVRGLPGVVLSEQDVEGVLQGKGLPHDPRTMPAAEGQPVELAAFSSEGRLISLLAWQAGVWRPAKNFPRDESRPRNRAPAE
jgi:tRNA pseudouridine55 synthase